MKLRLDLGATWRICARKQVIAVALVLVSWIESGAGAGAQAPSRFQPLDLATVCAPFTNAPALPSWALFPRGEIKGHGTPFRIDGWLPVTGLDDARYGDFYPAQISVLSSRVRADRLHLLLGAHHDDKPGVPVAKILLRYANGEERSFRIAYGVHVLSWMKEERGRPEHLEDEASEVAWSSSGADPDRSGGGVRLFQTVFENPLPEQEITQVEWVSLFSRATPFLAGLTIESAVGAAPPLRPEAPPRLARKALELKETAYRRELIVRALAAAGSNPLTNAEAALTIADDDSSFYFGRASADASGVIRLPYPPQQTVGFNALVRAPGHMPVVLVATLTNGAALPAELEATLAVGVRIAGMVLDVAGKPVGGAEINIHRVAPSGAKEFTRVDYEIVRTRADGRWACGSVEAGLSNLFLHVTHPEFAAVLYRAAGAKSEGARSVGREALLDGTAVLVLPPPVRIAGTVMNGGGKPVARAEVRLLDGNRAEIGPPVSTGSDGAFSVVAGQPGEYVVTVQAAGFANRAVPVQADSEISSMRVELQPARPFRGRVVDQNQIPVAGARVRFDSTRNLRSTPWQTVTDADGRFVWESPPESDVILQISATNYSSTRISFSGSAGERNIQLRRLSRAFGSVVDADTKKPIEEFQVVRGRSYNDEPIRWMRYDTGRGKHGEYSVRLDDYSGMRSQVLVEAPGYIPQASPVFSEPGFHTNNFELKKGRGISGVVENADGTPASGVTVALVDPGESVEMEKVGELRRNGSGPAFQRSNASGRFEFPPKFNPRTLLAASRDGIAQDSVSNFLQRGKLVLEPWGRVTGALRVGKKPERNQSVMLRSDSSAYYEERGEASALDLSLKAELDEQRRFTFEKVPPGARRVFLSIRLDERESARTAVSHAVPVSVKPNGTADVLIGGTGGSIRGRIVPVGADAEDLDWRRDVQQMSSVLKMPTNIPPPLVTPAMSPEEQQKVYRAYNERQNAYWRTPEGREIQRAQRTYALLFETNGVFHADNVEPGEYWLNVHITNPERGLNYYETIGSQSFNITVPAPAAARPDQVFDAGEFKLPIRGMLRVGRRAPSFAVSTFDGKPVRLEDHKGKYVLLDFWATWAGTRALDLRVLKEIYDTYGKEARLVMLGMNFDHDRTLAEKTIQDNAMKWTQCYPGAWGSTDLPGSFGIQGLPEAVLIDPEGRIIAKGLRGSNIRSTVRNTLSSAPQR